MTRRVLIASFALMLVALAVAPSRPAQAFDCDDLNWSIKVFGKKVGVDFSDECWAIVNAFTAPLNWIIGNAYNRLVNLPGDVANAFDQITTQATTLGNLLITEVPGIISELGSLAGTLASEFPDAIATIGSLTSDALGQFSSVGAQLLGVATTLAEEFPATLETIVGIATDAASQFTSIAGKLWEGSGSLLNTLTSNFGSLASTIGNLFDTCLDQFSSLATRLTGLGNELGDKAAAAVAFVTGLAGTVLDEFAKLGDNLDALTGTVTTGFSTTLGFVSSIGGSIETSFSELNVDLGELAGSLFAGVGDCTDWLTRQAADVERSIRNGFRGLTSGFEDLVEQATTALGEGGLSLDGIVSGVTSGFEGLTAAATDLDSLGDSLGGIGERLGRTVDRIERLAAALATIAENPDAILLALEQIADLALMLPDMLLSMVELQEEILYGGMNDLIDQLPAIAEQLPDLVEFLSVEFPVVIVEGMTQLIRNTPEIIAGLPDLISTKIDNLFTTVTSDVTKLLGLVAKFKKLDESTKNMVARVNSVLGADDRKMLNLQAAAEEYVALMDELEAVLGTASSGSATAPVAHAAIDGLEAELALVQAENEALRAEIAVASSGDPFGNDPVRALLWLMDNEPEAVQRLVVVPGEQLSHVGAVAGP